MREDIHTGHMKPHVPGARKPTIWTCGDPTIWVMGDPRSEDQLFSILGKTDSHTYYKYPQTPRYTLAKIILIKAFIHIPLKIDLSINR
jgi:hypothetical protein